MNKIAIIIPFKEDYSEKRAGAVSLWVKDCLFLSDTNKFTTVFGNLKKKQNHILVILLMYKLNLI